MYTDACKTLAEKEEEKRTMESIIKEIHSNSTDTKKLFEDIVLLIRAAMNSTVVNG